MKDSKKIHSVSAEPISAIPSNSRNRKTAGRRFVVLSTPKNHPFFTLFFLGLLTAFIFAFLGVLSSVLYFYSIQTSPKILRGISSAGINLSELSISDATIKLHKVWNLENKITVTNGVNSVVVSPEKLGIQLDPIQTADRAYSYGRSGKYSKRLGEIYEAWTIGVEIEPVVHLDSQIALSGLDEIKSQLSVSPVEASFNYQDGKFSPSSGKPGYTIDQPEIITFLQNNPSSVLFSGTLPVKIFPIQPELMDLSPNTNYANQLLDNQISLNFFDPISNERIQKIVPRDEIAHWFTYESLDSNPELVIDPALVTKFLQNESTSLGENRYIKIDGVAQKIIDLTQSGGSISLRIFHQPSTYTIQPGDTLLKIGWNTGIPYWRIAQNNPGINPDKLTAGQTLTIPSKDDLLSLPIVDKKRIVISISKQRLWVYENSDRIRNFIISTGIDRSPTQPGVFQVQSHIPSAYASVWDLTMPNFLGIYEAWPGFMNGIHGLPTLSNGRRLWANILGRPASYGCIILELDTARWLYNWAEDGVVVEIQP